MAIALAVLVSVPLCLCGQTTAVLFSMQNLVGTAANYSILVQPDESYGTPLWWGTNLVPTQAFTIQPVGGQVTTNLVPWGYTITVDGWPRGIHIVVPVSTNTLNAVSLINTNQFSPLNLSVTNITAGFTNGGNATFGNLTLINPLPISNVIATTNFPSGSLLQVDPYGDITWTTNVSVTNYSVSISQQVNSGTYISLNTNLSSVIPAFFSFTYTNRLILGTVPSFAAAEITGFAQPTNAGLVFPNYDVQWSLDGTNWNGSISNTVLPVLVSLYDPTALADTYSNVTVYSYAETNLLGTTNDFTGQITLVTQISDSRSAVSVAGADGIAAMAAATWSQYPAQANVNLAGDGLTFNGIWSVNNPSNAFVLSGYGKSFLSLAPTIVSNTPPVMVSVSVTTNIVLQIQSQIPPTAQYATNLYGVVWASLPGQVTTLSGGYYYVTAPLVAGVTNIYFRAEIAGGTSSVAAVTISANTTITGQLIVAANSAIVAPAALPGAGILWNSNNALYWVTSTHTNYLTGP